MPEAPDIPAGDPASEEWKQKYEEGVQALKEATETAKRIARDESPSPEPPAVLRSPPKVPPPTLKPLPDSDSDSDSSDMSGDLGPEEIIQQNRVEEAQERALDDPANFRKQVADLVQIKLENIEEMRVNLEAQREKELQAILADVPPVTQLEPIKEEFLEEPEPWVDPPLPVQLSTIPQKPGTPPDTPEHFRKPPRPPSIPPEPVFPDPPPLERQAVDPLAREDTPSPNLSPLNQLGDLDDPVVEPNPPDLPRRTRVATYAESVLFREAGLGSELDRTIDGDGDESSDEPERPVLDVELNREQIGQAFGEDITDISSFVSAPTIADPTIDPDEPAFVEPAFFEPIMTRRRRRDPSPIALNQLGTRADPVIPEPQITDAPPPQTKKFPVENLLVAGVFLGAAYVMSR